MVVVTGAAGFIASVVVQALVELGHGESLILVDDFTSSSKQRNWEGKECYTKIDRKDFIGWLSMNGLGVDYVLHLGARTDTTEQNMAIFNELNLDYSKSIFSICAQYAIPLIYASSAATYGLGEYGYDDDHNSLMNLKPLNPYGWSKHYFDLWVLEQAKKPPFWAGLKFFNVYGPNEYHKGRMASVMFHTYNKVLATGKMQLFKSHRADYNDGGQSRDFIYVKDVVEMIIFLIQKSAKTGDDISGIYNIGTGKARSFYDLASSVFKAMDRPIDIDFMDTPLDIRDNYQYFTEAKMDKLRALGYAASSYSLEDGITDYVQKYLMTNEGI